jgi:HD-like signal output (HDOD) protein
LTLIVYASTADELRDAMYYDPVLIASILRVANSALYGCREGVGSPSEAISKIGFERVKSICALLMQDIYPQEKQITMSERERLWKHAYATGKIACRLTRNRPWVSIEQAYVLGFLHDFGQIVRASLFKDEYQFARKVAEERKVPSWEVEHQLRTTHTLIGRWISRRWGFHKLLQEVMEYHHNPFKCANPKPELTLIALANIAANSRENPGYMFDDYSLMCRRALYITEDEWEEHSRALEDVWKEVDGIWNLLAAESLHGPAKKYQELLGIM